MPEIIIAAFLERLGQRGQIADFAIAPWSDSARLDEPVFHLSGSMDVILYVQACSAGLPTWKLATEVIRALRASGIPWGAVLLDQTVECGYLIPADEAVRRIDAADWPVHEERSYRVDPGSALHPKYQFKSLDALVLRLYSHGRV